MRKLILGLAVSLDGYIEDANGGYDWCFTDQDYGMKDFLNRIDAVFMGRKSYELMQQIPESEKTYMPKAKTYVFSTTLQQVAAGDALVQSNIGVAVRQIKSQAGKDIWLFGGASLTEALMAENLVDEFWLSVHPVLLGSGKPWWGQNDRRIWMQLLECKPYATGLVSMRFAAIQSSNTESTKVAS